MADNNIIQIHELNEAASVAASDVLAIDTGNATLKVKANKLTMGVKGSAESTYRTGNVNLTPANIGAHPANTVLKVTNNSDYTGNPESNISIAVAQVIDSNEFIRHQVSGVYNSNGSFYTILAARRPNGSSATVNNIGIGFNANGDMVYGVSAPAAFRFAIGLGNVNNSLMLTATTGAALYTQLNALPISPNNGAGVTCYINNDALKLMTGKSELSSVLHGVITRASTTRYRVFGMYGDTGYIMYWAFDITSSGTITPLTVYKLQGTAM